MHSKYWTRSRWSIAALLMLCNLSLLLFITSSAVRLELQSQNDFISKQVASIEARFFQLTAKILRQQPAIPPGTEDLSDYTAGWLLDLSSLPSVTAAYLVMEDGTYYASNAGNPQQAYIVTQDDSDYASPAKSMLYEPFWQHYFFRRTDENIHLWPVSDKPHHLMLTFPVRIQDRLLVLAIELPQDQWLPNSNDRVRATLYYQQKPIFSELTGAKVHQLQFGPDDQWQYRYRTQPHWHKFAGMAFLLFLLQLLVIILLRRRIASSKKIDAHDYDYLCNELSLMIVKLTPEGIVTHCHGEQPEEVTLFKLKPGMSIKAVYEEHPRYLTYLQHSLNGEPLTYEVQQEPYTFRVHQRPGQSAEGEVECLNLYVQEITEQRKREEELQHQQNQDPLTGLPNRQYFMEQLKHDLQLANRRTDNLALLALEISGLSIVNRTEGHDVADELLRRCILAVRSCVREGDTLCRFSDDEFILSLSGNYLPNELKAMAEELIEKATQPVLLNNKPLKLTANIGIATYPRDAKDAGSLISNAISAARHARRSHQNSLDYFSFDDARMAQQKWQLEQDISNALKLNEFALYYQPIFNLTTNQCIGAEALIRWPRSQLEPEDFLPLAEERGLIQPIGLWVIENALKQMRLWKEQSPTLQYICVNLSAHQLRDELFFHDLEQLTKKHPFNPGEIILEITESLLMSSDLVSLSKMKKLAALGFYLAVDDFGTGFSSLNYLNTLPIRVLKVDNTFTYKVPDDPHNRTVCEAIISMAQTLGLEIIAEGVETPSQMHWLSRHGVNSAQGYFYAKALPADELAPYLGIAPRPDSTN